MSYIKPHLEHKKPNENQLIQGLFLELSSSKSGEVQGGLHIRFTPCVGSFTSPGIDTR